MTGCAAKCGTNTRCIGDPEVMSAVTCECAVGFSSPNGNGTSCVGGSTLSSFDFQIFYLIFVYDNKS